MLIEKIPLGISYPPPSPPRGALRRAFAIPQSRNPPLVKTRHISTSVTQTVQPTMNLDAEAIEERRRRLEPSHRMPSTSSIAEEKVLFKILCLVSKNLKLILSILFLYKMSYVLLRKIIQISIKKRLKLFLMMIIFLRLYIS